MIELDVLRDLVVVGVAPQVPQHVVFAGKVRKRLWHRPVRVLRRSTRRDNVHGFIDSTSPIAAKIVVCFEAVKWNLVSLERCAYTEAAEPRTNDRELLVEHGL